MKFTKMHGCGNDYIFLDSRFDSISEPEKLARTLSDRHMGIGADGLVLIGTSEKADISMRMYNADGSVGEMCGNAIRCIGKYVYENGIKSKTTLTVDTLAGIKTLFLTLNQNKVVEVMVDLGKPIITAKDIPVLTEKDAVIEEPITILDKEFKMTCVSMGNPHAVIFTDNVANFPVATYGLPLEHNLRFPNRVNVEFVQVIDRNNIRMRVWERGTGETMACGTGTAASVVAGILTGRLDSYVVVCCLGGILKVFYDQKDNIVYLSGPAVKVYEGEISLEPLVRKE